jgi:ABC-2 type transport system permease protein
MEDTVSLTAAYRLGTRLFWRDTPLLIGTALTPVALSVGLPALIRHLSGGGVPLATVVFQGSIALLLALTALMNITMTLAVRRDQLVLKRLRCTRLTDAQILLGQIAGTASLTFGLIVLCTVAARFTAGVPLPADPLAFVLVTAAGSAVLTLLGAAYTAAVPRAELTPVFTMPVFLVAWFASGAIPVPLPGWLETALGLLPTTAVVDAVRTGDVVAPLLILAAWTAAGLAAIRLWFRWEPRRS